MNQVVRITSVRTLTLGSPMTAPVASGWSDSCRVGLAPTEERRLSTAHTHWGHSDGSMKDSPLGLPQYMPATD